LSSRKYHLPARWTFQDVDVDVASHHSYIPWSEEKGDITSCGIPINYNASKEWKDKKVVLFALPGTFMPASISLQFVWQAI
jgi:peroxiredoxin